MKAKAVERAATSRLILPIWLSGRAAARGEKQRERRRRQEIFGEMYVYILEGRGAEEVEEEGEREKEGEVREPH